MFFCLLLYFSLLLSNTFANKYNYYTELQNSAFSSYDLHGYQSCYFRGFPKYCKPIFINASPLGQVYTSSTCGVTPMSFCWISGGKANNRITRECAQCDGTKTDLRRLPSTIIDASSDGKDFWASEKLRTISDVVNITWSVSKRYELQTILIEFLNKIPDSFVILRTTKNWDDWKPWHYFSSDCEKVFNMKHTLHFGEDSYTTPLCSDRHLQSPDSLIATIEITPDKSSRYDQDYNTFMQEWSTANAVKIQFVRFSKNADDLGETDIVYSIRKLQLLGRCKCNGHASRCVTNDRGHPVCACQHGTNGKDCENCASTHNDQPWSMGTPNRPGACKVCSCNGYSQTCKFDSSVYRKSHGRTGSQCEKCSGNTVGIQCERCKPGYYFRSKRSSAEKQCVECKCDSLRSISSICDSFTGKCRCRENAMGKKCGSCGYGYQNSKNPRNPCEKVNVANDEPGGGFSPKGSPKAFSRQRCLYSTNCKRLFQEGPHFKKFCKRSIAIRVRVIKQERKGGYIISRVEVLHNYKSSWNAPKQTNRQLVVAVEQSTMKCHCLRLGRNKTYLIFAKYRRKHRKLRNLNSVILLTSKSFVYPWKRRHEETLKRFQLTASTSKTCRT